jgi:hypothetical protein
MRLSIAADIVGVVPWSSYPQQRTLQGNWDGPVWPDGVYNWPGSGCSDIVGEYTASAPTGAHAIWEWEDLLFSMIQPISVYLLLYSGRPPPGNGISHNGNVATFPTTSFKPQRSFNLHIHQHKYLIQHLSSQKFCILCISLIMDNRKNRVDWLSKCVVYRYHHTCHPQHDHEMR